MIALVVVCSVLAALIPCQVDGYYHYYNRPRHYPVVVRSNERIWKEFRVGEMRYGSKLLYETRISHSSDISWRYCRDRGTVYTRYRTLQNSTLDVELPPQGKKPIGIIHLVEAFHLTTRSGRWSACITRGGVNHNHVTVRLESDIKCGMDYYIRVFGC